MLRLIQPSFARGEIGPALYGRVDISAYAVAVRIAWNMVIHSSGGASNRAGLLFVGPCSVHSGTPPRLIEFKFNTSDTYILEFGDFLMRVIRNDAYVLNPTVAITGVTQADPGVVTAVAHGFSNGEDVYIADVVGMTELNARWFKVANATANTFDLTSQQTGANVDTSAYTAYSSGGTVSLVYQIATPYAIADTLRLKKSQTANVMTFTHKSYPTQKLSRTGHTSWVLEEVPFKPLQAYPTGVSVAPVGTGTLTRYQVTATNSETQEESLPGLNSVTSVLTAATAANPVVITSAGHPHLDGDEVEINAIVGMVELNGRRFEVSNKTANTFELTGEDGTAHTAYVSGGTANATFDSVSGAVAPKNTITFAGVGAAEKYSVYREDNGLFGWIGDTEQLTFLDDNIAVDLSLTPPRARNPFYGTDNYPGVVSSYEQRRIFGATNTKPDTNYYSVVGSEYNMSHASPRRADDAITAALNSSEVNEIRAYVPMNDLLIFTSGGEWRVNSGDAVGFSAETLRQKPQSTWGCSFLDPIVVGDKVLFSVENASYVRSIGYEITIDGYKGNDMTVFAPHIFRDYPMTDWAATRWPDPVINIVRSDGVAPAFTFNPEQEVVAWTRWGTDGKFLRVASTRPNATATDSAAYFVVQRTIGGSSAYYVERVASRRFKDVRDCFFVDSGLSLDNPVVVTDASEAYPVVITAATHGFSDGDEVDLSDIIWTPTVDSVYNEAQPAQLNDRRYYVASAAANTFELVKTEGRKDITGATQTNPIVVTSAGHGYANGEVKGVFNVVGMTELNGNTYKIANVTTDTYELTDLADVAIDSTGFTAYASGGTVHPAEDGSAFNAYKEGGNARLAVSSIGGAWHLEGREVVILADGNVISGKTIVNGLVSGGLAKKASRVHLGLRYVADLGTLTPEVLVGGQTSQGRLVRAPRVTVRLQESRGLLAGPDENNLVSMKQREFEVYGEPTQLLTGDKELEIESDWEGGGKVYLRQVNPLPLTVLAVIPHLDVGQDEDG